MAVCYCDHEAEVELEAETSVDTQPRESKKFGAPIDRTLEAPIDIHHGTESDARAEDAANFGYLRGVEFGIFRDSKGQAQTEDHPSIDGNNRPSIDGNNGPSIDGLFEFGKRAYDSSEHAEKFTRTMQKLRNYSRADIDDMVHGIYRAHEMSLEDSYRRLDDV
ncbi:hypothetical protein DY000_02015498 [Brassica cretica]|uniref:DUF1771 domain-containing protein n=1 Tax=Brassica cretica TaxID=69181 RepID=A0ABQ7D9I8_BRACR|nr:hypothetical protein DY000_02015498 [Brassica cretica]